MYALRNNPTLANMAINNIGASGQKVRKVYQRRLPENPSKDYYYIIRETDPLQSILVEYGFIDNSRDATKLRNNLNSYVEGVVKAIADYYDVKYTVPGSAISGDEEGNIYTVKPGDTLYKISNLFNVPVDEIKRLNNLSSNILSIGQQLIISDPSDSGTTEEEYITYIVQPGDSLSKLATIYNTDINTIKSLNDLTSNTIIIGQELKLPNIEEKTDNSYGEYIVEKGDSLWKIANKFGTTVDDIIKLNDLTSINLQIGDILKIPGLINDQDMNNNMDDNSDMDIYVVQRGDTLWSIARKFNISVDDLKSINSLTSNLLSIGQSLIIPRF